MTHDEAVAREKEIARQIAVLKVELGQVQKEQRAIIKEARGKMQQVWEQIVQVHDEMVDRDSRKGGKPPLPVTCTPAVKDIVSFVPDVYGRGKWMVGKVVSSKESGGSPYMMVAKI